ncbi:MAG: glycosyltransferase family 2 protein, partial [Oscillospiraceae bacterium]
AKAINETKSEFLYSDEALFKKNYKRVMVAHFKPNLDYSYLLSCNYICHLACFKRDVFNQVGGFDPKCSGSQDHDLFLKILEKTKTAYHIDKVLYYWRVHAESTSGGTGAKPYVAAAAKRAIENHLERIGVNASVIDGKFPSTYKVCYEIGDEPLVSIIIPNKDHEEDLQKCINSIYEKTVYKNFEIIIAENNSTGTTIFYYYEELEKKHSNLKIVRYEGDFNYSKINNFATSFA